MVKIFAALLAIMLVGGCGRSRVTAEEFGRAEELCSNNGGVTNVITSLNSLDEVRCADGAIFKYAIIYNKH